MNLLPSSIVKLPQILPQNLCNVLFNAQMFATEPWAPWISQDFIHGKPERNV